MGVPYSKAIEDYCKFVNDEKLLGDDKLVCFIKDDNYKTENTKRNFEAFLDEGIVLYLNYSTGSTLALGKDFDEEKIPTISKMEYVFDEYGGGWIYKGFSSYGEIVTINNPKELAPTLTLNRGTYDRQSDGGISLD